MSQAADHFEDVATSLSEQFPDVDRGQLFGKVCLKVSGKAFAAFHQDMMVFKLGNAARDRALAKDGAQLWDPSGKGRPMKDWVQLPDTHADAWSALAEASRQTVSSGLM